MLFCETILRQTTLTLIEEDSIGTFFVVLLVQKVGLGRTVEIFMGKLGLDRRPCFPSASDLPYLSTTSTDFDEIFDYEVSRRVEEGYRILPPERTEPFPIGRFEPMVRFMFSDGNDGTHEQAIDALRGLLASQPRPAETLAIFLGATEPEGYFPITESDPLLPILVWLAEKRLVIIFEEDLGPLGPVGRANLMQRCPPASRDTYAALGVVDSSKPGFAWSVRAPESDNLH